MMDNPRTGSGNGDDNLGIPDDLRCKRSDGKQWRCTAMSMPDKTVCEKHYIQAKRRAANSALRASLKKAKRKSLGESDVFLESKGEDYDVPLANAKVEDYKEKYKEKMSKSRVQYSPETPVRSLSVRNPLTPNEDWHRDSEFEENWKSHRALPFSAVDSSRSRSQRSFDEYSDGNTDSSEDAGGQTCHQCRRNDRNRVIWCRRCDRRGFCHNCISAWYFDISLDEIEKVCPACRGICNCKACLRGDNMVKVRIREIPVLDKLQYLYFLLASVLPVVKQIHHEQCMEVELEKKLRGNDIDLIRAKLNADEQMCCNICRIPIIDYHRHCANCTYDMCLHCCQDLREASSVGVVENQMDGRNRDKESVPEQLTYSRPRLSLSDKYPNWTANPDGSIPCPPKEYGGCNYSSLNLSRIFKMNWVAKLVKNVEEMVRGCKVSDADTMPASGMDNLPLHQYAHREDSDDNFLYCPSSEDLRSRGIKSFRKHWIKGEPIIVKQVYDSLSMSRWDPMVVWRGIRETSDEKMKDENRIVKAIDCLHHFEVDIELGEFIKGYFKGQTREDGTTQMLKLKDWPPPGASEEFLLYQRPEYISKLPLFEYIHSRLGLLNVAAKLPHYSLQNDAGPKIFISYGTDVDLGIADSVTHLHIKMRDMVYLLMHTHDLKQNDLNGTDSIDRETNSDGGVLPDLSLSIPSTQGFPETAADKSERMDEDHVVETPTRVGEVEAIDDQVDETTARIEDVETAGNQKLRKQSGDMPTEAHPGVRWSVFRRHDVPKLITYAQNHFKDSDNAALSLCEGTPFLDKHHLKKLKEEFGVEPWSFEQNLGEAVFVPAGCPFQARNLQSTVLLGLDFLSPESVGEAARLAEEIRCLPNDCEAKLQVLEVGKISLYAASSAIKDVQKLVLDPKLGAEIGFEDCNLTAAVSANLEKLSKQRELSCA